MAGGRFPAWAHQPSPITIVIGLAVIGSLVGSALNEVRCAGPERMANGAAPQPWLVGIAALAVGLAWFVLLFLAYGAAHRLPVSAPLLTNIGLAELEKTLRLRQGLGQRTRTPEQQSRPLAGVR